MVYKRLLFANQGCRDDCSNLSPVPSVLEVYDTQADFPIRSYSESDISRRRLSCDPERLSRISMIVSNDDRPHTHSPRWKLAARSAENTHRRLQREILKLDVLEVIVMSAAEPFDPQIFCGLGNDSERRHEMIAQAAYFRSKHRHFVPGKEAEDWLAAETEVDQLLAGCVGTLSDRH
jgi:hypothetical protein